VRLAFDELLDQFCFSHAPFAPEHDALGACFVPLLLQKPAFYLAVYE
jgi:hypothetical protein